jgi:hypothetical protein
MACSEKETALREILGPARVDAALARRDEELRALSQQPEIFEAAGRGLSALSLDAYLLSRGPSRARAREEALAAARDLPGDTLDLLIVAVCARHRLERP